MSSAKIMVVLWLAQSTDGQKVLGSVLILGLCGVCLFFRMKLGCNPSGIQSNVLFWVFMSTLRLLNPWWQTCIKPGQKINIVFLCHPHEVSSCSDPSEDLRHVFRWRKSAGRKEPVSKLAEFTALCGTQPLFHSDFLFPEDNKGLLTRLSKQSASRFHPKMILLQTKVAENSVRTTLHGPRSILRYLDFYLFSSLRC